MKFSELIKKIQDGQRGNFNDKGKYIFFIQPNQLFFLALIK